MCRGINLSEALFQAVLLSSVAYQSSDCAHHTVIWALARPVLCDVQHNIAQFTKIVKIVEKLEVFQFALVL